MITEKEFYEHILRDRKNKRAELIDALNRLDKDIDYYRDLIKNLEDDNKEDGFVPVTDFSHKRIPREIRAENSIIESKSWSDVLRYVLWLISEHEEPYMIRLLLRNGWNPENHTGKKIHDNNKSPFMKISENPWDDPQISYLCVIRGIWYYLRPGVSDSEIKSAVTELLRYTGYSPDEFYLRE